MFNFPTLINIAIILIPFIIFLLLLIYLTRTYFLKRDQLAKVATIVFITVFLTTIYKILASSLLQYYWWANSGGLSEYLLPPHQPITYFLRYSWQHFILSPIIGIVVAFLIAAYFLLLNRIFKKQYVDFEDMLILVSGAMIVGWPNLVIYIGIAFSLTIFRIFYLFYIKREMKRVPLTGALIIAAFLTLLVGDYLVQLLQIGWLKV